jgi:two-component system cell cycle sensor histidine kinase/response regulator CckA
VALVMTDMVMPRMGGKQLADSLSEVSPDLPVLFMSGYTEDVPAQYAVDPGTFIQKPFEAHDLLARVRRLIDARRESAVDRASAYGQK